VKEIEFATATKVFIRYFYTLSRTFVSMQNTLALIRQHVKHKFASEGTGHDWHHIERVTQNALRIAEAEGGDLMLVELAALLHDIDDHKFNGGDLEAGARTARQLLSELGVDETVIEQVTHIIATVSYKGAHVHSVPSSLEGKIVQDADRLDAIGAIGIARAFAYGGSKNRPIYDPKQQPELHETVQAYISSGTHTINHFYEKLLLLKDKMNTETGKRLAAERHAYMENYLAQFYREWNGNSN
jgi:uncharacterized protein